MNENVPFFQYSNTGEFFEFAAFNVGNVVNSLKDASNMPNQHRQFTKLFSAREVSDLCGYKDPEAKWLKKKVRQDRVTGLSELPCAAYLESGQYRFTENELSSIIASCNKKKEIYVSIKKAICIVFSQYKGGVGKTISSSTFASIQAIRGRRVLVIDCDPQASITELFTSCYLNSLDSLGINDTIMAAMLNLDGPEAVKNAIKASIRKTAFSTLDIIPGCQILSTIDRLLGKAEGRAEAMGADPIEHWSLLKSAVKNLEDDYDLIVIDCPPAISPMNTNAVFAADILINPLTASMLDCAALVKYYQFMGNSFREIGEIIGEDNLSRAITRVLITNFDGNPDADPFDSPDFKKNKSLKITDEVVRKYLLKFLPGFVIEQPFLRSDAIKVATNSYQTLIELDLKALDEDDIKKNNISPQAYKRACQSANLICDEIELLIEQHVALHQAV